MTNKYRTTLYIGVTSNLESRVMQHRNHLIKDSFTDKYNLIYCIYYESFMSIYEAIAREKQLKKWTRKKKEMLINTINPGWQELVFPDIEPLLLPLEMLRCGGKTLDE